MDDCSAVAGNQGSALNVSELTINVVWMIPLLWITELVIYTLTGVVNEQNRKLEFSLMITVLVVDDNGPVRDSLRYLLETADDIELVATATNGIEAVEKADSYRPDVAVIDISMPLMDGIEATEHIRECCRLTMVIILSIFDGAEYIQRALEVGAKGYVLKDSVGYDLLEAIRVVHRGNRYFSEKITDIAEKYVDDSRPA